MSGRYGRAPWLLRPSLSDICRLRKLIVLYCAPAMDDREPIFAGLSPRCNHCDAPLSLLPDAARFCPSCGNKLNVPRQLPAMGKCEPPVDEVAPPSPGRTFWLRFPLRIVGTDMNHRPEKASQDTRTSILVGYASALFHLGWRYEMGLGASRNRAEAARCYTKAAHMGDASAAARLQISPDLAAPSPAICLPPGRTTEKVQGEI